MEYNLDRFQTQALDNSYLFVGAPNTNSYSGSVYVYEFDTSTKVYNEKQKLTAKDNNHNDYFKGQVFTAYGYQIFESGAIRHGKFKHFRTDKSAGDCDFSQVPIHSRGKIH